MHFKLIWVKVLSNFTNILGTNSCPKNQFTCSNKRCVASKKTCDGNDDCGDDSDEILRDCGGIV